MKKLLTAGGVSRTQLPKTIRTERRKATKLKAAAYDAAGSGRRTKAWNASSLGPNSILSMDAEQLRRRSHDQLRQNPWAFSAVESWVANTIGTGLAPQSLASDRALRKEIQRWWGDWVPESQPEGFLDFYGQQGLVGRGLVEGGECFARIRERRPEDGLTVPLQVQLLEAEHLPSDKNEQLANGNLLKAGIEFDRIGRRVAYWMYRIHPGEAYIEQGTVSDLDLVRVPAANVLHVFRPLRPGQIRGEPWMARVLIRLHEIDKYDDAELVKQQIAALFTGWIETPTTDEALLGEGETDETGLAVAGMSPGELNVLDPGQKISFSEPPSLSDPQGFFTKHQLRGAAAGMNVPYANMTGDVSDANYSSLRAAMLELRRRCESFVYQVMTHQFCRPIYRRWLEQAVLAGRLDARGYLRDPMDAARVRWIGDGWPWVDPLKEVMAAKMKVRCGFASRSQVIMEQGEDPEQVDNLIAEDNARADERELVFDSDARHTENAGTKQADLVAATDEGGPRS